MLRSKRINTIAVCSVLSACASYATIESAPVTPQYKAAASQLKANAIEPVTVRAFQSADDSSGKQELIGVSCVVSSAFYEANVVTPGIVQLPSFAQQTPAVTLSCTQGEQTVTRIIEPYNKTVEERTGAAGGGLLTYAIVAAATREENSVFTYGLLSVEF